MYTISYSLTHRPFGNALDYGPKVLPCRILWRIKPAWVQLSSLNKIHGFFPDHMFNEPLQTLQNITYPLGLAPLCCLMNWMRSCSGLLAVWFVMRFGCFLPYPDHLNLCHFLPASSHLLEHGKRILAIRVTILVLLAFVFVHLCLSF